VTSENALNRVMEPPQAASENRKPGRRGATPTPLPAEYDEILGGYAAALEAAPLSADTRRTYVSRVRQYLAWLHRDTGERRFGDPLTLPGARDWAVRDYRRYLLREADPKRSVRYCNNTLAALDDFYMRRGLGKADIARDDLPRTAPRALDANAQVRWLRAVRQWPHVRDRALALSVLVVYGKGGKIREVPVHPELRPLLQDWINARRGWPGAGRQRALFLNRRGGRLSRRGASDIFTAIAANAGLDDKATAHIGRHTFVNELIRGGEDLVIVAEIAGHARLETLRVYSQPTDDDKHNALRHLTVDR
jgi:integrase